jgi:signal transduction histidine kinase
LKKEREIKISVQDTGIGVAEELKPIIFSLFGKPRNNLTKLNSMGAGLGLTLSNLIVFGLSGG